MRIIGIKNSNTTTMKKLFTRIYQKLLKHSPTSIGKAIEKCITWLIYACRRKSPYLNVYTQCEGRKYDVAILVPWLIQGGADLVAIHFINTLAEKLNKTILVLSTENTNSIWKSQLAKQVCFIELGKLWSLYSLGTQTQMLSFLIQELKIPKVHIMNSRLGWEFVNGTGKYQFYASLYADEIDKQGNRWGYAQWYLPKKHPMLTKTTSDNQTMLDYWSATMNFSQEKCEVIYTPTNLQTKKYQGQKSTDILWASRLTSSKCLDVLLDLAKKMHHFTFHVYGTHDPLSKKAIHTLSKQNNVVVHGAYNGFSSLLDRRRFLCFVYTSKYDGIPNVILEAIANGLTVIAPDIGGIKEVIHESTGYLIANYQDSDAYAKAIKMIYNDPSNAETKWQAAVTLLEKQHGETYFIEALQKFYAF